MSKYFDNRPESLCQAIYYVALFLGANPILEIPLIPMRDDRGFIHDDVPTVLGALDALQCVNMKADWLRDAWVKWIEIGLDGWEKANGEGHVKKGVFLSAGPDKYDWSLLRDRIDDWYLGPHFERIEGRYLGLLNALRKNASLGRKSRKWFREEMIRRIMLRRDGRFALARKYGLQRSSQIASL